jgi:hypothetical protein
MMDKVTPLNSTQIEALKQEFELLTFPSDFDLVYENQIPCTGIALIEGQIELIRDAKVEKVVANGNILGITELLLAEPVRYGARVKAKSKIILLGKSDILNFRSNARSKLHAILTTIESVK